MEYPNSIERLKESFKRLPGVGEKSAERYAFFINELDKDDVEEFSKALLDVKQKIKRCPVCNNITEKEKCDICTNENRDRDTICVVENIKNVFSFESLSVYNGLYFVLDGLISPIDGIGPEDINIDKLVNRIKNEKIKEVILAINPSIEGETTLLYIQKLLENYDITVTRIAHGIPLGADIEYIDPLTLEMALNDRKEVS